MAHNWSTVDGTDGGARLPGVLATERRRLVVAVLARTKTPVSLPDLASLVARREADRDGVAMADRTDAVHVALFHKDVPKLADAAVVAWDRDRDLVRPGAAFQDALPLVEAIERAGDDADAGGRPAGPFEPTDTRRP